MSHDNRTSTHRASSPSPTNPLPVRQARDDGLSVSAIGLGCMGMSEFYGPSDDGRSRDLIHYALDRGERFFDTADIYGFGHNEELVGSVLRDHPLRADIVLATGPMSPDGVSILRRSICGGPSSARSIGCRHPSIFTTCTEWKTMAPASTRAWLHWLTRSGRDASAPWV